MRLPFESAAAAELEDAATWYERERRGYGGRFVDEVARVVNRAAELPQSGKAIPGLGPERDVRRFVVRRFPYSIVVSLVAGERTVVAVAHARRAPGYWRDRLSTG